MNKLLLACALAGTVAAAAVYADQKTDRQPPTSADRAAHLQQSLQLSDEQTAKVKQILANEDTQRKALHDKYQPQLEAFRTDAKKLHDDTRAQLNGVLTPKQQQALDAQRGGHRHFAGTRFGHRGMNDAEATAQPH